MWGITRFSNQTVTRFLECGYAVDGTKGGLLVGPSHDEGGILILRRGMEGFRVVAEIEGGEFIFSAAASKHLKERLEILNNITDRRWVTIVDTIPDHVATIDCTIPSDIYSGYDRKFLVLTGGGTYYIINKHSTWKHLELLDKLNKEIPCVR